MTRKLETTCSILVTFWRRRAPQKRREELLHDDVMEQKSNTQEYMMPARGVQELNNGGFYKAVLFFPIIWARRHVYACAEYG